MKKYTKRLLAFLLATAMVVTGVPMSAKEAKAEDVSVTLDFGRPTGGTILATDYSWDESIETFDENKNDYVGGIVSEANVIDGTEPTYGVDNRLVNPATLTKSQFVNKTVAVDRYSCGRIFTKSFAGANYVINPAKTTIPTMEGFDNVYINASKDTTPGLNIQSWNGTGAASYLQVCDGTVAFDFTVPVDGNYAVTVLSSTRIPSTAATVTVNDVVIGATLPGSVASGTAEQPCNMESSVVLKAGETNTVSFTADASGRAWVRSITFTKLPAAYSAASMNIEEGATFDIGNVFELVTSAALDDGSAVESEALSVVYDSTNKEVATVTDNVLVAVAEGTTTITAAVSYNGEYKETISRNISVSFDGVFEVDLLNDMDVTTLSTQKNGGYLTANTQSVVGADTVWSVNAEKSAATSLGAARWFSASGLQYDINATNSPLAIDFEVPVSGKYDISADLYIYAARGSKVLVKINEDGEAALLSNRGGEPETQNLNTTYLNAGTNTIYISQNANGYFWIKGFTFTLNTTPEALPEYTVLWTDEAGNVLEEDIVAQGTVPTYDGEVPTKAADTQFSYAFAGWDKEVVAATGDVTYVAQFTATAATYDLEVKLDFGRPTDGTILSLDFAWDESIETFDEKKNDYVGGIVTSPNVIDGTEPTYGVNDRLVDAKTLTKTQFLQQTVTVDRYHTARYLTKGFVGANYVINPEKTTFATVENVDNVYIFAEKDATPGLAIQSWSGNGAASYLQVCDGTVAFDFTVPEDGNYVVVATSCSRTPSKSATVAVNDVVIGATLPATLTTGSAGQDCGMNSTVNLKAGEINTVSFTADASGRAWIRSVTFLKVPANYVAATMNVEEGATFDIGNTFELVASAILDDEAVVSDERVSATFTSSNTDVATITDGVLVAVGEGETTITAEVSYNGEYKETITRTISVAFDGVFEVDFSETDPSTVVTDGQGRYYMDGNSKSKLGAGTVWSINAEQTSDTYKYDPVTNTNNSARFYGFAVEDGVLNLDNAYLQVGLGVDDVLAIDFEVPVEGRYAVDADMLLAANGARAKIKVGEDGRVAIVTSRSAESEVSTQPLKRVYLEKGTNTIYISQSIGTYFGINSITFTLDTVVDEFTVTWDVEGVTTTETYQEDTMPEYKGETPVKEADAQYTYEFAGWTPKLEEVYADVTYTAKFDTTVNTYTVTWLNDDGSVIKSEEVAYGEIPTCEDPVKEADAQYTYTFIGWDKEVVEVTGEVTYTAIYEKTANSCTVTWMNFDGTVLATETYNIGEVPEYKGETPVKEADAQYTYTFIGWDKEVVPATEETTYTAVYEATVNEYTVTWMNFDGTVIATETYEYGATPEYKGDAPVYNDYAFTGWSPEVAAVEGDATYTAQFEMSGKSIEWFDEDGDGVKETGYYYVDGAVKKGAGLVEVDGYLYYVLSSGKISKGENRTISASKANGLIEPGTYYIFKNGVLETEDVRLSGEIRWVEEKGKTEGYYYVMGEVRKDVGLVELWNEAAEEETWYLVLYSGKVRKNHAANANGKRVNSTVKPSKVNRYAGGEGVYSFYDSAVMYDPYATETGIVRYDENGKPWYYVDGHIRKDAGLVYVTRGDLAGNYIFVTYSGTLKKGTHTVREKKCNGHTEFVGTHKFDNNTGAMIIK